MHPSFNSLQQATIEAGFSMASNPLTGSLLQTLAASKPGGRFLELGTGTGLSTSWILAGMDEYSILESVDNDEAVLKIAANHLGDDGRLTLTAEDGEAWVNNNRSQRYDFIFADTWHGKYLLLDEVLEMLSPGAWYVIDDMLPQPNWPEGHAAKAEALLKDLQSRTDLTSTWLEWSTGILVAVKNA